VKDYDDWFFPSAENCMEILYSLESILGKQYILFGNEVLKENAIEIFSLSSEENINDFEENSGAYNTSDGEKQRLANLLFEKVPKIDNTLINENNLISN